MKRFRRFELCVDLAKQIQQARIDLMNLSVPVIAEQMVDLGQGFRDVTTVSPVHNLQFFTGMQVIKGKRSLRSCIPSGFQELRSCDRCKRTDFQKGSSGKR